jgi:hypothetical protein
VIAPAFVQRAAVQTAVVHHDESRTVFPGASVSQHLEPAAVGAEPREPSGRSRGAADPFRRQAADELKVCPVPQLLKGRHQHPSFRLAAVLHGAAESEDVALGSPDFLC